MSANQDIGQPLKRLLPSSEDSDGTLELGELLDPNEASSSSSSYFSSSSTSNKISDMPQQDLDNVIVKLRKLESKLETLFSLPNPIIVTLENNFTNAVKLVTLLLDQNESQTVVACNVDCWKAKLERWSMQYDAVVSRNEVTICDRNDEIDWTMSPPREARKKRRRKKTKKRRTDSKPEEEESSCFIEPSRNDLSECSMQQDVPLINATQLYVDEMTEQLKEWRFWIPWKLANIFGQTMDVKSNSDLSGMYSLLVKFSEAFQLLDPSVGDQELQQFGFYVAYRKLPKRMRVHFEAKHKQDEHYQTMLFLYNYVQKDYEIQLKRSNNLSYSLNN